MDRRIWSVSWSWRRSSPHLKMTMCGGAPRTLFWKVSQSGFWAEPMTLQRSKSRPRQTMKGDRGSWKLRGSTRLSSSRRRNRFRSSSVLLAAPEAPPEVGEVAPKKRLLFLKPPPPCDDAAVIFFEW